MNPLVALAQLAPAANPAMTDSRSEDDAFLLLRDAVRKDDIEKVDFYASRLTNYQIPSYVDYYRLRPRIRQLTEAQFRDYLARYQGSAIADRFRNDWLLELGRKRDWVVFDEQYPQFALDDDTQLKCYALMSRIAKGQNVADEARKLLLSPPGYGEACGSLIAALSQSGQFDSTTCGRRSAWPARATLLARRAASPPCWALPTPKWRRPSICLRWCWPRARARGGLIMKCIWWLSGAWRAAR